ncbi:hypothetical protein [Niallia taxi]|uniref:hypothetical protein n=1 Tax=Niallia taxi TaxID=2499688 RepID=UPI0015F5D122|nr:hypothetical protein [Niallia taxi]
MNKTQIMRERERQSLHLSTRLIRGKSDFGLYWTNRETSYTDGDDLFIFTNPNNDERTYTEVEARTIRKGHAYHELGHILYDNINDYRVWCKDQAKTYPAPWVRFFGNTSVDGRMENYLTSDYPRTQDYIDFMNYEWCFGNREASGERVKDFRFVYMHYSLGMTLSDIDGLNEEALELCDSIRDQIEEFRSETSTKKCLSIVKDIMEEIWDTIKSWMEEDSENGDGQDDFGDMKGDSHDSSSWGETDQERTERNNERASKKIVIRVKGNSGAPTDSEEDPNSETGQSAGNGNNEGTSSEDGGEEPNSADNKEEKAEQKPDFKAVIKVEERAASKDEEEAQDQQAEYQEREENVSVDYEYQKDRVAYSDKVIIRSFPRTDISRFNSIAAQVRPMVKPLGKTLKELLKPIPDKKLKNQKQGGLKVSRVWRATTMDDPHIFERNRPGTPAKDASILFMNDCSGSTGCRIKSGSSETIIDQMRKNLILGVLAAEEAGISCGAYGFHEGRDTEIFPLKPFNRKLGEEEKSFLGGLSDLSGNRDTLALQWSINQLEKRDESVKVLFMISDGQPCFSGQENEDTMTALVKQAHKKGIDVLCLYIGPLDSYAVDAVKRMYPNGAIIVDNPAQLPRVMGMHVKRIVRQRRR